MYRAYVSCAIDVEVNLYAFRHGFVCYAMLFDAITPFGPHTVGVTFNTWDTHCSTITTNRISVVHKFSVLCLLLLCLCPACAEVLYFDDCESTEMPFLIKPCTHT